jgi:hypothetical protein
MESGFAPRPLRGRASQTDSLLRHHAYPAISYDLSNPSNRLQPTAYLQPAAYHLPPRYNPAHL